MHGSGEISNDIVLDFDAQHTAGYASSPLPEDDTFTCLPYPDSGPEPLRLLDFVTELGAPDLGPQLEFPLHDEDWQELQASQLAEGLQAGPELEALRIPGGFRGGESDEDAASRGMDALEQLAQEFSGQRVLVVTHGTLIRLALSRAIGRTLDSVHNAVLNLAHHHASDGWKLEYFNGELLTADVDS